MTTVKDIYNYIDLIAPFDTSEEWDNAGLLVGDFDSEVETVVVTLDCTKAVVDFAKGVNAQLIISHHPLIFNPLTNIKKGTAVYELIENGINLISAHTCYDKAVGGINDCLAELLGLMNTKKLDSGFLVSGELDEPMSIDDFASLVNDTLSCHGLRYTDTDKLIKTVAVGGGACFEFIEEAMDNADCFVTGDIKYHEMLDASELCYPVISAGHFETESKPFLRLKDRLEEKFSGVKFLSSPQENAVLEL